MVYKSLAFPTKINRPFFYTNFVATVDGKVQVESENQAKYWPIGSKTDYETLLQLRSYADVLIYGKNTAANFDHGSSLAKPEFKKARRKVGKYENILYLIVCNTTNGLQKEFLNGSHAKHTYLVMPENAQIGRDFKDIQVVRVGKETVSIPLLSDWLQTKGFQTILVEGGPRLLGSFLSYNLIDEIFLTIAPKIFGNEDGKTLTLVEGHLFPPDKIKQLKLLAIKQINDELFLRYKLI